MKCVLSNISAALVLGAISFQPALAQQGADLVKQAVDAQGGASALRALNGLSIKADAKHWEPGQSYAPGGEPRFLGDSAIAVTWDVAKGTARTEWNRDMKYPFAEKIKFTETVLPTFGIVTNDKGRQPMSGIRVASLQRELGRTSPALLVKALDNPQSISALPDQKLGERSLPAVSINDRGMRYTVLFDPATKLPAAIRTRDDDHVLGDSNYDVILSDWRAVGGAKLPYSQSFQLNGVEVQRITYKDIAANPTIAADTFAVSDSFKVAASAAAAQDVPYQWVLRRMFLGRFLDSDKVLAPADGGLKLVELAPNVQQVVGGSANDLIVAMKDGLVIFDAPVSELQSRWVIDAAKAKYPGKPIKYLVLTHHHMDHIGGTRTYVAEGATVIVPSQAKAYFEKVLAAPHTVAPDALQKQAKPLVLETVADTRSLKDDTVEIRLHNIPSPHADGMIIGHVVQPNIVWVTDIWSPGRDAPRNPNTLALAEAVKKIGIKDATFAGGHGSSAKQSVLETAVAQN